MFKYFAFALMVASAVAADTCDVGKLTPIITGDNGSACEDASGYKFTSGMAPDEATAKKMCETESCHGVLDEVKEAGIETDCTIPLGDQINLKNDLIDPVQGACSAGGDAPASSGDAAASGGDAPASGGDEAPASGGEAPASGGEAPAPTPAPSSGGGSAPTPAPSSGHAAC